MKAFKLLVNFIIGCIKAWELVLAVKNWTTNLWNLILEGGEPLDVFGKEYGISDYEDIELFYYYKNGSASKLLWTYEKRKQLWLASFNVEG